MLLLIVFVALLVIGIVFTYKCDHYVLGIIGAILTIICSFATAICLVITIVNNTNVEGRYAGKMQQRDALVFQLENETYLNDNNVGTVELFKQIGAFNDEIIRSRLGRNNIWYGMMYVPWADRVELIELGG